MYPLRKFWLSYNISLASKKRLMKVLSSHRNPPPPPPSPQKKKNPRTTVQQITIFINEDVSNIWTIIFQPEVFTAMVPMLDSRLTVYIWMYIKGRQPIYLDLYIPSFHPILNLWKIVNHYHTILGTVIIEYLARETRRVEQEHTSSTWGLVLFNL